MNELTRLRRAYAATEEPDEETMARARQQLLAVIAVDELTTPAENGRPRLERFQGRKTHRRRRWGLVAAAVVSLMGALLVSPAFGLGERLLELVSRAPAGSDGEHPWRSPAWSPDGRRILVSKLVPDNTFSLYVMNADGTGLRIMTRRASNPVWSPDGRTVAVIRYAPGTAPPPQPITALLYVIEADGSGGRLLAEVFPGWSPEASPAWSPNGRKIAFLRNQAGVVDVYVMNADGTGTRRLAQGVRMTGDSYHGPLPHPVWSPDGRRIAFVSDRSGTNDLYVMNADGTDQRRLTRDSASEYGPVWSPDGEMIAFTRRTGEHWSHNDDLYVIRSDGAGLRSLTRTTPHDVYKPVWSRGGRQVFFQSEGQGEIYVVNADGSGMRNLTRNRAVDGAPDLSPDGRRILFVSGRGGSSGIYVMNADGSDQRRLIQLP